MHLWISKTHSLQFILTLWKNGNCVYHRVLSTSGPDKAVEGLHSWKWSMSPQVGSFIGLYPRSWMVYEFPELKFLLICKQVCLLWSNFETDWSTCECFYNNLLKIRRFLQLFLTTIRIVASQLEPFIGPPSISIQKATSKYPLPWPGGVPEHPNDHPHQK